MTKPIIGLACLALLSLLVSAGCQSTQAPGNEPLMFFPMPPAEPRIQFLTWSSGAAQVAAEQSAFARFTLGEDDLAQDAIKKPYGVAIRDGVVFVCDTKLLNIARLDFKNMTYSVFGDRGPGRLRKPINIAVDDLGFKFVADPIRRQIVVFDPQDRFATAFNLPEPCHPVDVVIHGNELYVLDNDDSCQIVVLARSSGEVIRTFGAYGNEPGQFNIPNSLCVGPDGSIYVSDTFNHRIQKLTNEGEPVWQRGNPGYRLGQFGRPRGIRTGPDGTVYIVDGAMQLVQMFNPEGDVLMRFGGPGNIPGSMVLPSTLAIDTTSIPCFKEYIHEDFNVEYLIIVASQYGQHLINIYAFGSFPEGYRLETEKIATLPFIETKEGLGPVEQLPTDTGHGVEEEGQEGVPKKEIQNASEKENSHDSRGELEADRRD